MAIWQFEDKVPKVGSTSFVSPSADVIGDVVIGEKCYIGPGAVIRGDYGRIRIGDGCSIQENVVIHARPDEETIIGNNVTLGHGCIVHNATIHDNAVVGMGAVISDYVTLEEWAVIGEGALAPRGKHYEKGVIAVGVPAKVIGNINDPKRHEVKEELIRFKHKYMEMAQRFLKPGALKKLE